MKVERIRSQCGCINKTIEKRDAPGLVKLKGRPPQRQALSAHLVIARGIIPTREPEVVKEIIETNKKGDPSRRALDQVANVEKQEEYETKARDHRPVSWARGPRAMSTALSSYQNSSVKTQHANRHNSRLFYR